MQDSIKKHEERNVVTKRNSPKQGLTSAEDIAKQAQEFSMDYSERGSHARGVYPTQNTSRMETARVKQEKETDTRIM